MSEKQKLEAQLEALKLFPNNNLVRKLRKQTKGKLKRLDKPKPVIKKEEKITQANIIRSGKLRRYWQYVKLIRNNFPNLTIIQIRKQLAQRMKGQDVSIPDAVWQNPSP